MYLIHLAFDNISLHKDNLKKINIMNDLYKILGLNKTASQDEIKNAYKKLAIKNHPDKGGDEKTFQNISNAYNILSDPKKKQEYDNGGQQGHRFNGNHDDIFAHFFGARRGQQRNEEHKCNDILKSYKISLKDAFTGLKRTLKIKLKAYNHEKTTECENCNGKGRIKNIRNLGIMTQVFESQCNTCNGVGYGNLEEASYEIEKTIELVIPKGIQNNHKICIDECGEQPKVKNKKAGNLIFNIEIQENDVFKRENNNLHTKMKIDFISSICGANVKFNIMDEEMLNFNTSEFGIVYPNKKYEFKNKGMPIQRSNNRGNLYLEFEIDYPKLTDEQRDKLRKSYLEIFSS